MGGGRGRKRGRRGSENGCACAACPRCSHGTHGLLRTMPFSMLGSSTKLYSWKHGGAERHTALGPSEVFAHSTLSVIYKVAKRCARCRGPELGQDPRPKVPRALWHRHAGTELHLKAAAKCRRQSQHLRRQPQKRACPRSEWHVALLIERISLAELLCPQTLARSTL